MMGELWNALLSIQENTYRCRLEEDGRLPRCDNRVIKYEIGRLPGAREYSQNEVAALISAYKHGFGGSMRRSEPHWHEPKRRLSPEHKAKLKAIRDIKRQAKAAKRKTKPKQKAESKPAARPLMLTREQLFAEITALRDTCPEWQAISVAATRGVADRLDKAFKAFFSRAQGGAGKQSGYPKYKRSADWSSISFTEPSGSGWSISRDPDYRPGPSAKSKRANAKRPGGEISTHPNGGWLVYVKGVPGVMKARGRLPVEPLAWRTGEIIWRDGAWWLSVAVDMAPRRKPGTEQIQITFDLIDEFARAERANGESLAGSKEQITPSSQHLGPHPGADTPHLRGDENAMRVSDLLPSGADTPHLRGDENGQTGIKALSPGADTPHLRGDENRFGTRRRRWPGAGTPHLRGDDAKEDKLKSERDRRYRKFSWRWFRATRRIGRIQASAARRRKHAHHMWTTDIVRRAGDLTVICPAIKENTVSPRGDAREWGADVKTVSALNRHIVGQAPAMAIAMLRYKAEEAEIRFDEITDEEPNIAIGAALVDLTKKIRRAKRQLKEEKAA